ncbi:MAG TPA: hypothetical protein VFQ43_10160 [Nitrososphaera sp.]|nr:hypothetical protein [Nitrososphaera sp.]
MVETDRCTCGLGPGSPRHRTVFCPELRAERRLLVEAVGAPLDFDQIVATPGKAQQLARWFVRFGMIKQFDLAAQLIEQHDEDRNLNGDGPPANQSRRGRDGSARMPGGTRAPNARRARPPRARRAPPPPPT